MSSTAFPLDSVRAIAFDIDGVLSPLTLPMGDDGVPRRMANLRDGFSMLQAVRHGLHIAIISGAVAPGLQERFAGIGIKDIFLGVSDKEECFDKWIAKYGLDPATTVYVGDDVPDLVLLRRVGLPVCPADADREVRATAKWITKANGGYGVAREVIQQIMLAQGTWPKEALANYDTAKQPKAVPPQPSAAFESAEILLASNSPRRRELLGMIVPAFTIAPTKEIDETYPADLPAAQVPAYLSRLKAAAYLPDLLPGQVLLTADTVVILDGEILGKPRDEAQAIEMLSRLSGRTHTVVTGVTISSPGRDADTFTEATEVTFADIPRDKIKYYVRHFRPLDKAGAYGVQEYIGAIGIRHLDGCYYNVMGLPLHTLHEHLTNFF